MSNMKYIDYLTEQLDKHQQASNEEIDRKTIMDILEKNPNLLQEVILELRNKKIDKLKNNIKNENSTNN